MRPWLLAIVALTVVIAGLRAPSAAATFPGRNGDLAFSVERDLANYELAHHTGLMSLGGRQRRFRAPGYGPAFAPDGRTLAVTAEGGGILVADLGGGRVRRLTDGNDVAPAWSPSGDRLAFTRLVCDGECRSGGIFTVPRDGGEPQLLVPTGLEPAWSRTGTVAFVASRSPYWRGGTSIGERGIHVVSGAGGPSRRIIARGDSPDWSPRGRRLVFTRSSGGFSALYVANADGTGERRLRLTRRPLHSPRWSPDGRSIVYLESYDGYRISPTGRDRRRLPRFPCAVCERGRHVVFSLAWQPLPPD